MGSFAIDTWRQYLVTFDVIISQIVSVVPFAYYDALQRGGGIFKQQIGATVLCGVKNLEFVRVSVTETIQPAHVCQNTDNVACVLVTLSSYNCTCWVYREEASLVLSNIW